MLSALNLKAAVQQHFEDKVEVTETISASFHKCVLIGKDKSSKDTIVVKATSLYGDGRSEEKRLSLIRLLPGGLGLIHFDCRVFAHMLNFEIQPGFTALFFKGYSRSLRDVLQTRKLLPLPASQVKGIAYQVLSGLRFLHNEDIVHTDIKPDNILLVDDDLAYYQEFDNGSFTTKCMLRNIGVKIGDYDEFWDLRVSPNPRHAVGTVGYRAPELLLGEFGVDLDAGCMPWSASIDMFAFAATIGEIYLGRPMFPASTVVDEQLAILQHVVGHFSTAFIHGAFRYGCTAFSKSSYSISDAKSILDKFKASKLKHISLLIRQPDLQDLLKLCLIGDADSRYIAQEAIEHRYFRRW
ncbi:CMGC/CLK protein kinase [Coprinopsis sp. MPI-PUGE-AT-0042]|nr:CMGC/CLK protein kinase [Coprinopsis sp. MPI-PUGE-AT-0042]